MLMHTRQGDARRLSNGEKPEAGEGYRSRPTPMLPLALSFCYNAPSRFSARHRGQPHTRIDRDFGVADKFGLRLVWRASAQRVIALQPRGGRTPRNLSLSTKALRFIQVEANLSLLSAGIENSERLWLADAPAAALTVVVHVSKERRDVCASAIRTFRPAKTVV